MPFTPYPTYLHTDSLSFEILASSGSSDPVLSCFSSYVFDSCFSFLFFGFVSEMLVSTEFLRMEGSLWPCHSLLWPHRPPEQWAVGGLLPGMTIATPATIPELLPWGKYPARHLSCGDLTICPPTYVDLKSTSLTAL